ncbi:MAG TPA: hypothetical protein VFM97_11765 [Gammaproteobacteria bacterium]|nr:hypothetical protein [Gammaproteobacteria bacterium]
MPPKIIAPALIVVALTALSGCSSEPTTAGERAACANGLNAAYDALNFARSKGFGGTVDYTKAAALLGAAKIQQQFDEYDNCVIKVREAQRLISESQQQH